MTKKQIIEKTEQYVKQCMKNLPPNVHDFKHVDRVRKWALKIAKAEGKDLFLTEITALLHDIGRAREKPPKILHADIGAKMAYNFLIKNKSPHFKKSGGDKLVTKEQAKQISYAIAHHGKGGKGWLVAIIQDADKLDGFGAIGIIRGLQESHKLPEYLENNILGKTIFKQKEIQNILKKRKLVGRSAIENINFQISWYKNIHTKTAKKIAKPLVEFMKKYRKQFIKELKKNI